MLELIFSVDLVITIILGTIHQHLSEILQEGCCLSKELDLEVVLYSDGVREVKCNENASFANPLELG